MEKKHVKIELREWSYTCGDGCCTDEGVTVSVNDTELRTDGYFGDSIDLLVEALEALGYEVEVDFIEEEFTETDDIDNFFSWGDDEDESED